jgi:undecaprenol kinase
MNKKFSILSFQFAFEGLVAAFKQEPNLKFHFLAGFLVIILGLILNISKFDWVVILILIGFVIAVELTNTAIESVVDGFTQESHPAAKTAKDISAGAVLIAALTAIIVFALGDAASFLIGKYFGRYIHPMNPNKHVEGLIAAFVFGIPAALIFLPTIRAFIVAAFAAVIETANIRFGSWRIDDNLSVPLAAGLITSLLYLIP